MKPQALIFDIGMFDGSDSRYFLDEGYRVVAVEANPELAEKARQEFQDHIAGGRLSVLNFALADEPGEIELVLCGDDLGASSIFGDKIAHRNPSGTCTVPTITFSQLVDRFGVPDYVKVDIEGADRHCILAMGRDTRPRYLSFEADAHVGHFDAHVGNGFPYGLHVFLGGEPVQRGLYLDDMAFLLAQAFVMLIQFLFAAHVALPEELSA